MNDRARAAETIMNYVANNVTDGNIILAGDLNTYGSSEAAYQELTVNSSTGLKFIDPIYSPGSWNNNASYAPVHTQSTHYSAVGCKSGGGLDDRFDFILLSDSLMAGTSRLSYDLNSYTTVGNDGNHYNQDINNGTNSSVSANTLQALYDFSDHLPVFADFEMDLTGIGIDEHLISNLTYANPAKNHFELRFPNPTTQDYMLHWIDLTGRVIRSSIVPSGTKNFEQNVSTLKSGLYLVQLAKTSNEILVTKKIVKN